MPDLLVYNWKLPASALELLVTRSPVCSRCHLSVKPEVTDTSGLWQVSSDGVAKRRNLLLYSQNNAAAQKKGDDIRGEMRSFEDFFFKKHDRACSLVSI